MRSVIAAAVSAAMLVGQVPLFPAFAQTAAPAERASVHPSAVVDATFKAFPSGGDPLSLRIADLVSTNPRLAAEFVVYMQTASDLSRAQKLAAEQGLAAAADRLGINAQVRRDRNDPWAWVWALATAGVMIGGTAWGASQNHGGNGAPFVFSASRN